MRNKLTSIVALTAALAPALGNAIGFGEITLQSRIGEALMAEVPILLSSEEIPVTACFSLAPIRSSDLPVITTAKTRLVRRGQNHVLQVFGTRPVSDPVFTIALQAGCGYDVVRDYVLMPDAPFMPAETSPVPSPIATGKPAKFTEWHAREGETLEDIADAQTPASLAERQRLIAALKRANPDLAPDSMLGEGTVVRIPTRKQASAEKKEKSTRTSTQAVAREGAPQKPAAPRSKPRPDNPAPTKAADQLLVGAAPEEIRPREKGNAALQSLAETEQRLLRLETTLHLLTQEVEKMDQALDLATKAIEIQNKLQMAQTLPASQAAVAVTTNAPAQPAETSSTANWLELLLSAAVGAAISIGLAQYLGRRHRYPGEEETPLAFASHRSQAHPAKQATPDVLEIDEFAAPPSPPRSAQQTPAPSREESFEPTATPEPVEMQAEDEHSVLALAEIMLSFGRVRGAAETLAEHIDQHMPQSIQPWSMLLDLYRRGGMRQEFEALAEKMRSRFNASIPAWNDSGTPISGLKSLEDYPHVIQKAGARWGTQACLDYLLSLVHDTRAGQRNGFPLEVVEEIALLMAILEDAYALKRQG